MDGLVAIMASLLLLSSQTLAQNPLDECRDCTVGDCLSVPKAEGGCDACICNGLLMPDCELLNCSITCDQLPTPDGCLECVCPDIAQDICPPIPACPSRCQVQLGSGCPRCTCPDEVPSQCPAVTCPTSCTEITGPDGCPACECPPEDRVCPELPACPLGCIDESSDPIHAGCLECNCTIIEELLAENQIIPVDEIDLGPDDFDVELVPDSVDSGLLIVTEEVDLNFTPIDNLDPTITYPTDADFPNSDVFLTTILPNQFEANNVNLDDNIPIEPRIGPDVNTGTNIPVAEPFTPNANPQLPEESQNANPGENNIPESPQVQQTANPESPQVIPNINGENNQGAQRVGSSGRPQDFPNRQNSQPSVNIPCGETSCPPGCTLCIQNNSCGRCLCGNAARICAAVPACQPACISSGPGGCFTCGCPAPGNFLQQFHEPELRPFLGPQIIVTTFDHDSEERFIPILEEGPIIVPIGRGHPGRPPPVIRGFPVGRRGPSTGQIAIQNIPQHLLGTSRFQFFT
uniref:Nascent polypeptide-associated complex subunit alpha, muscle-specific form-like n=1 Tax=Hirondellea gigas TaxID=1518452 RepID=A0A2P2HZ12_9CRUS